MARYRGIAISGKAAAGKDTVGEAVLEHLVVQWTPAKIWKLADPIYEEAYAQGMSREKKDRKLLQNIGAERIRQDTAYYPRRLLERIRAHDEALKLETTKDWLVEYLMTYEPSISIVTDLRKQIEAEYLRYQDFALVRLDINPTVQQTRLIERDGTFDPDTLRHWTETDLDHYPHWDLKIRNDGELSPQELAWIIVKALGMEVSPEQDERRKSLHLA